MALRLLLVISALALGVAASSTPDDASDSARIALNSISPSVALAPSVALPPSIKVVAGDVLSLIDKVPHLSRSAEGEIKKLDQLHEAQADPVKALGGLVKGLSEREKNVAPALSPDNRDQVKKTMGSIAEVAGLISSSDDKNKPRVALPPGSMDALLAAVSARKTEHEGVDASDGNAGRFSVGAFVGAATAGVIFWGFF